MKLFFFEHALDPETVDQEFVFAETLEEAYELLLVGLYAGYGNKRVAQRKLNGIKKYWTKLEYDVVPGRIGIGWGA